MYVVSKILVVDDEPDLAALFRQKFRQEIKSGTLVFHFAADGVEALEALQRDAEIDILFTDLRMPRLDGLALLGRLHEFERVVKAVVVTAYDDLQNVRTSMNRGAFDFLVKPIDLDDLETTLYNVMTAVDQQKREVLLRETFGRYLPAEVGMMLLAGPEAVRLGGERREVTLLMSDVRGFSQLAERLSPEQVVELLNIYLGSMADVITRYGGTIDEFIGDAIFVIFGAPFRGSDDAARAVACAVAMQQAMGTVNARLAEERLPALTMGIGINTGEVVAGNIGSAQRMKYGVVGSEVNLTGRIEGYSVGGQILMSERTRQALGPLVRTGRRLQIEAKGFARPIAVYEVVAIGAPYDLAVPGVEAAWVTLARPLAVTCTAVEGKHLTGAAFAAEVVAWSGTEAVVRMGGAEGPVAELRIALAPTAGEAPGPEEPEAVYARVVETDAAGRLLTVRFTSVPDSLEAAVRQQETAPGR